MENGARVSGADTPASSALALDNCAMQRYLAAIAALLGSYTRRTMGTIEQIAAKYS